MYTAVVNSRIASVWELCHQQRASRDQLQLRNNFSGKLLCWFSVRGQSSATLSRQLGQLHKELGHVGT